MFRVVVNDGFTSTFADSSEFVVPDHSPLVQIVSPTKNAVVSFDQSVVLEGFATDLESGALDDSIEWTSDGESLGTGASLVVDASGFGDEGPHTITAEISVGAMTASDDVVITTFQELPKSLECAGQIPTLLGTSGSDSLLGTPGDDVMLGKGGKDRLKGGAGRDAVCGSDGDDKIEGGAGTDRLFGGPGKDVCTGGPARDRFIACERRQQ